MSQLRSSMFRAVKFSLGALKRRGITIEPFFIVREGENSLPIMSADPTWKRGFLDKEEAEAIAELRSGGSLEETRRWFEEGRLCFGIKDGTQVIAKMWCDLDAFHYPPNYRELEDDEVYFYAAVVSDNYRGKNIAPLMRQDVCKALQGLGRKRFYSYTEYFNLPARRFKEKLGVRNEALRLHLSLFDRWQGTWTLRKYA